MELNIKIPKNWVNTAFFPFLKDYNKRYNIYYGGAGSGKSQFVFQKMILKSLTDKRKILCVRKVAKTNLNSTFQMCLDILNQLQILSMCKINSTLMKITLPNGSVFIFVGMDDSEKIKSIAGITDIVIEEATEISLDDFSQLDLRLRAKVVNSQIYLMLNPVSKTNWVYKRWFAPDVKVNEDDTFIHKSTYTDNRFLPKSYVDSLMQMRSSNPAYFRIYANGEWASLDKLVYTNWEIRTFEYTKQQGGLCVGLDFGFTADPSALVASIVNEKDKTMWIFDEWYQKGKVNSEIADAIKAKGYVKSVIIADAAEQKSIEELKRLGVYRIRACVKGPDSVLYGIQQLQQYRMYVHPKCKKVLQELQNYCWTKDKATGEYINKPIDVYNHTLDALRYSIQALKNNRLKTIDKSKLGL